ncbi:MAG: hypothetical protein JW717_01625 [Marinilabiliaceae bacterium]|nr:hypothetical protein [Marinilabiliaceae bacterium]
MIEKIYLKSRVTEIDAVGTRIIVAYEGSKIDNDTHLANIITGMKSVSSKLNESIQRLKAKSALEEKDEARDSKLQNFYYLILGFVHHPEVGISEAANKVMQILNINGLQIISESYATETSLIHSVIRELDKPEMKQAMALLSGGEQSLAAVKESQSEFEKTYSIYEADKALYSTYDNASSLKTELVKIINNQLVTYLRAMVMVNEAAYGNISRTIGQIIADNNETVKKRTKRVKLETA